MTRFLCVSDMHGYLPDVSSVEFDVMLIGGDTCPVVDHRPSRQTKWLDTTFRRWLSGIAGRGKTTFGVAGNHDLIMQRDRELPASLPWIYLQDSGYLLPNGMLVYGSPWQPTFGVGWAFNQDELRELWRTWAMIPDDADILLLHGPPMGIGDLTDRGEHVGSPSLAERIRAVQPRLAVCGHIHNGYGRYQCGDTVVVNASHVDERYEPVNLPIVVEIN